MPNSILWIGLVALWLFVLFPMLAARHPRIRQTADAALATRVLYRGGSSAPATRGPAAGHVSDPEWRSPSRAVRVTSSYAEDRMEIHEDEPAVRRHPDDHFVPTRRGRGGFDPEADAIAQAARYTFRQRAVSGLFLAMAVTGVLGFVVGSVLWWGTAAAAVIVVGYLVYLRRQVRLEAEIRRRRMARAKRLRAAAAVARGEVDPQGEPVDVPQPSPSAPRGRAVAPVLEADDGDPAFDQLPSYYAGGDVAVDEIYPAGLRRAAGE